MKAKQLELFKTYRESFLIRAKKVLISIKDFVYFRFIKPIKKARRRRKFEQKKAVLNEAIRNVIENFEPLLIRILNETYSDYEQAGLPKNGYTIQMEHDIKRLYQIKIKDFINSNK